MFEAVRRNLFALCSKMTWPLSSETIFTAKKPGSSAGCLTISSMRDCSSARVAGATTAFVDVARLGAGCAEIERGNAAHNEAIKSATYKRLKKELRFRFINFISLE